MLRKCFVSDVASKKLCMNFAGDVGGVKALLRLVRHVLQACNSVLALTERTFE